VAKPAQPRSRRQRRGRDRPAAAALTRRHARSIVGVGDDQQRLRLVDQVAARLHAAHKDLRFPEILAEVVERRAARAQLEPAEHFLRRLVRALPWSEANDSVGTRTPEGEDVTLKIDHQVLRQQLRPWLQTDHPWEVRTEDANNRSACWGKFVELAAEGILQDYANGEVDHEGAVKAVCRCALACAPLAMHAAAVRVSLGSPTVPEKRRRRRPVFPSWVQRVAVTLVHVLKDANPSLRISEDSHYDDRPTLLHAAALEWLVTLGVLDVNQLIRPGTIDDWRRKFNKDDALGAAHRPLRSAN
jgi:hypothetical protein